MKIYRLTLQSLQDTEMNSNAQSTPVILDITSHLTSFFLFLIFKSTLLSSVAASLLMRPETSEQLKLIRVDPDLLPVVSLYWAKTDQSSLKSFKSVYSCFFFLFVAQLTLADRAGLSLEFSVLQLFFHLFSSEREKHAGADVSCLCKKSIQQSCLLFYFLRYEPE